MSRCLESQVSSHAYAWWLQMAIKAPNIISLLKARQTDKSNPNRAWLGFLFMRKGRLSWKLSSRLLVLSYWPELSYISTTSWARGWGTRCSSSICSGRWQRSTGSDCCICQQLASMQKGHVVAGAELSRCAWQGTGEVKCTGHVGTRGRQSWSLSWRSIPGELVLVK